MLPKTLRPHLLCPGVLPHSLVFPQNKRPADSNAISKAVQVARFCDACEIMTKAGAATAFVYEPKHPSVAGNRAPASEQRFRFRLREARAYCSLVHMIKRKSLNCKSFQQPTSLHWRSSSGTSCLPSLTKFLSRKTSSMNSTDVLKNIAKIQIRWSPGKRLRQGSFPAGVNGGSLSSLGRTGPSQGIHLG